MVTKWSSVVRQNGAKRVTVIVTPVGVYYYFMFYGNRIPGEKTVYNVGITMMMLIDCALIIQALPNSDIPVVKLTSKSVC